MREVDLPESGARVEVGVEEELDGELERLTTHRLVRRLRRTRLQHTGDTCITHMTRPQHTGDTYITHNTRPVSTTYTQHLDHLQYTRL